MADDNNGKISSGDTARDIAKVKEAFNSTASIDKYPNVKLDFALGKVMVALPIALLLLMGIHVLMTKVKTAENEQGELGVARVVGLIVIGLVMLLAFIYMTTLN